MPENMTLLCTIILTSLYYVQKSPRYIKIKDKTRQSCYNTVMDKPAHLLWLLQRSLENLKEISTSINWPKDISTYYIFVFLPAYQQKYRLVCLITNIQNDHERSKSKPKQFWIILKLRQLSLLTHPFYMPRGWGRVGEGVTPVWQGRGKFEWNGRKVWLRPLKTNVAVALALFDP